MTTKDISAEQKLVDIAQLGLGEMRAENMRKRIDIIEQDLLVLLGDVHAHTVKHFASILPEFIDEDFPQDSTSTLNLVEGWLRLHLALKKADGYVELGYHNAAHCIRVACRAYELAANAGYGLGERLILLLAGMWHDYGYLLQSSGDLVNIPVAVASWQTFGHMHGMYQSSVRQVGALIWASHFPYVSDDHPNIAMLISPEMRSFIRTADLGEITEPNYRSIMLGLCAEMTANGKFFGTFEEFWDGNRKFLVEQARLGNVHISGMHDFEEGIKKHYGDA
jgi:hypothetical protein